MRLRRLQLRRAPGIDKGFVLDELAPGLNLVVGPNGSGKSTLCRVLRATLWPDAEKAPGAEAVSQWEGSLGSLRAELAGRVRWQREGDDCPAPSLPAAHLAAAYSLGLRDLLDDEARGDQELARIIQVQMAGGYDLAELRRPLQPKRGIGRREEDAQTSALRELSKLVSERSQLAAEDRELTALRAEIEQVERAVAQRDLLTRARRLAECRREHAGAEARRAGFAAAPEAMERLSGQELEQLAVIEAEEEELRGEQNAARQRLELALEDQLACGLEAGPLPLDTLDALVLRASRLVQRSEEGEAQRRQVAAAQEQSRTAWRALAGEGLDAARLADLSASELEPLSDWTLRAFSLRERRVALEHQLASTGAAGEAGADESAADEVTIRSLVRASELLREWLDRPARAATFGWLGRGTCGLFAAAAAAASFAVLRLPGMQARFVAAGLAGCAGIALGMLVLDLARDWLSRRGARRDDSDRLAELGVEAPQDWSVTGVRERLAQVERSEQLARERAHLRGQLAELAAQAANVTAERERARLRVGLDRPVGELALADLLDRVRAWRRAELAASEAAASLAALESECAREQAALGEAIGPRVAGVASVPLAIQAQIEDLRRRCERWREAERTRHQAERESEDRARQLERRAQRRLEIFRKGGFEAGEGAVQRRELERRLSDLDEWKLNEERFRSLQRDIKSLEKQLSGEPELRRLDLDAIDARLRACAESGQRRDALRDRINDVERRVREASEGSRLEEQRARVADASAALASRREELLFDLAADFLLESVEKEHQQQSQPPVLRRAAELFARFTRHRYALTLGGSEGAEFRAIETGSGEGLSLSQLSDGTRMQLLLAARLAFATEAEASRSQPPLLLDEALTASDPERFRAVASSLLEWSGQGRQVFYLTCNPADVGFWYDVCREARAPEPRVIDLGRLRGLAAGVGDASRLRVAPRPVVPAPGNLDAADYGKLLGVPLPDPFAGVDALHLFHLLRSELPLLHRILSEAGVVRVGEWRSLRSHGAAQLCVDEAACARVDAWGRVAEAVLDAWCIGRGRPVDRGVLEASGAVSDRFIDGLSELAAELGGDARRLMLALEDRSQRDERSNGFRAKQREALRSHLEERGHLPTAEPLEPLALRSRVLARVGDLMGQLGRAGGVLARAEVNERIEELMQLLG